MIKETSKNKTFYDRISPIVNTWISIAKYLGVDENEEYIAERDFNNLKSNLATEIFRIYNEGYLQGKNDWKKIGDAREDALMKEIKRLRKYE